MDNPQLLSPLPDAKLSSLPAMVDSTLTGPAADIETSTANESTAILAEITPPDTIIVNTEERRDECTSSRTGSAYVRKQFIITKPSPPDTIVVHEERDWNDSAAYGTSPVHSPEQVIKAGPTIRAKPPVEAGKLDSTQLGERNLFSCSSCDALFRFHSSLAKHIEQSHEDLQERLNADKRLEWMDTLESLGNSTGYIDGRDAQGKIVGRNWCHVELLMLGMAVALIPGWSLVAKFFPHRTPISLRRLWYVRPATRLKHPVEYHLRLLRSVLWKQCGIRCKKPQKLTEKCLGDDEEDMNGKHSGLEDDEEDWLGMAEESQSFLQSEIRTQGQDGNSRLHSLGMRNFKGHPKDRDSYFVRCGSNVQHPEPPCKKRKYLQRVRDGVIDEIEDELDR